MCRKFAYQKTHTAHTTVQKCCCFPPPTNSCSTHRFEQASKASQRHLGSLKALSINTIKKVDSLSCWLNVVFPRLCFPLPVSGERTQLGVTRRSVCIKSKCQSIQRSPGGHRTNANEMLDCWCIIYDGSQFSHSAQQVEPKALSPEPSLLTFLHSGAGALRCVNYLCVIATLSSAIKYNPRTRNTQTQGGLKSVKYVSSQKSNSER